MKNTPAKKVATPAKATPGKKAATPAKPVATPGKKATPAVAKNGKRAKQQESEDEEDSGMFILVCIILQLYRSLAILNAIPPTAFVYAMPFNIGASVVKTCVCARIGVLVHTSCIDVILR